MMQRAIDVVLIGLFAFAVHLGCNPDYGFNTSSGADPYDGFFDPSVLTGGFAAQTSRTACPKGKCYPVQQGFLNGKPFLFYNLFNFQSSMLASDAMHPLPISSLVSIDTYDIGTGCTQVSGFDRQRDAYRRDKQYPIFNKLPTGTIMYPFVGRHMVSGLTGETCNDLKNATSITGAGPGTPNPTGVAAQPKFGAMADTKPTDYQMWTVVDPTALFANTTTISAGWYNNLQMTFLNSGQVPTDQSGNLVAMTGVIVNPSTGFAKPTDPMVIIVPHGPGEPGYSPIVVVKNFALDQGQNPGDFTGICNGGGTCGPKDVDITTAGTPFYTLFIYAL
jgi:hypothetical protein